jgi:DivIVA domain-containing protein
LVEDNSIDRIRSATFTIGRRGYEKREVERFLNQIADWLETGGSDQARSDVVKRELERIGQRTAGILASAEDSAEQLRVEADEQASQATERARAEAARSRKAADEYSEKTRKGADEYSAKTRKAADEYGAKVRTEADEYSARTRTAADVYAGQTRSAAESDAQQARAEAEQKAREAIAAGEAKAQRIIDDGIKRRRDVEAVIADLVERRDQLIADATSLANDLRGVATRHTPAEGEDRFATPKELDPKERVKA